MLLTAIAVAYSSSASMVENNHRFFTATQSGRVALNQILTEVRRCDSIDDSRISPTLLPIMRPAETRLPNEVVRIYKYDAANKRLVLYFERTDGSTSTEYPLAEAVQSSPFSWEMGTDANNTSCVAHVAVVLDVKQGGNQVRLSGSAAPRRSLAYK